MEKLTMENIQMVDLISQYASIKDEIDVAIAEVLDTARFVKGPVVKRFESELAAYLGVNRVINCANGTDALQLALMALDLKAGDEVIVPAFTYVATAEVIALLGLTPIMVDVDPNSFNTTAELVAPFITSKTKAIIPVHLFGQCSEMEDLIKLAEEHNLFIIEDNAQAIGSSYTFNNGKTYKSGCMGHIGTTSFFPSKNLGCYGDGGAIFTNDEALADKIAKLANHGQSVQYFHDIVGVNSRLDAIQAAVLSVKLKRLDQYCDARREVANRYDEALKEIPEIQIPFRAENSNHVFHQYTMQIRNNKRDALKTYLSERGIPSMIYYPVPLYKQKAFSHYYKNLPELATTEMLCESVLSLPIHTEMKADTQSYIIESVRSFFNG